MQAYQQLEKMMVTQHQLTHAQSMLSWDEAVMMPTGAGEARAETLAMLRGLQHLQSIDPTIGDLIADSKQLTTLSPWQRANLHWIEKNYINATLIPNDLITAFTKARIKSEQQWRQCRKHNDWQTFYPYLETTFKLAREIATLRARHWQLDPYDAMIESYSPNFRQADIDPLFTELEQKLPTFITAVMTKQQQQPSSIPCQGPFAIAQQQALNTQIMHILGFDFNHGRLDTTHHPFCGGVPSDVRITTHYNEHDFLSGLYAVCHETGHGCYEQGLPVAWRTQPVGEAIGMAMHESQSLLMEMQVCRSRQFLAAILPLLKQHFGEQKGFTVDNIYQLINTVKPSLIRIHADEITYPLHVILRYKLEQQLMRAEIQISDLPAVWDSMMQNYLGLSTQGNDKDGVMQDVHWAAGLFGYFPSYTTGRLIAAQLFETIMYAHPDLMEMIAQGDFSTLKQWLQQNIYNNAKLVTALPLVEKVTGKPLSAAAFLNHIEQRYL